MKYTSHTTSFLGKIRLNHVKSLFSFVKPAGSLPRGHFGGCQHVRSLSAGHAGIGSEVPKHKTHVPTGDFLSRL